MPFARRLQFAAHPGGAVSTGAYSWQAATMYGGGYQNAGGIGDPSVHTGANRFYAVSGTDIGGTFSSSDGGLTWKSAGAGLTQYAQQYTAAVFWSRQTRGVVWSLTYTGGSSLGSPWAINGSTDFGNTWQTICDGTALAGQAGNIEVTGARPRNVGQLLVVDEANGVAYVASKGGVARAKSFPTTGTGTVTSSNIDVVGLSGLDTLAVELDPVTSTTIYASSHYYNDVNQDATTGQNPGIWKITSAPTTGTATQLTSNLVDARGLCAFVESGSSSATLFTASSQGIHMLKNAASAGAGASFTLIQDSTSAISAAPAGHAPSTSGSNGTNTYAAWTTVKAFTVSTKTWLVAGCCMPLASSTYTSPQMYDAVIRCKDANAASPAWERLFQTPTTTSSSKLFNTDGTTGQVWWEDGQTAPYMMSQKSFDVAQIAVQKVGTAYVLLMFGRSGVWACLDVTATTPVAAAAVKGMNVTQADMIKPSPTAYHNGGAAILDNDYRITHTVSDDHFTVNQPAEDNGGNWLTTQGGTGLMWTPVSGGKSTIYAWGNDGGGKDAHAWLRSNPDYLGASPNGNWNDELSGTPALPNNGTTYATASHGMNGAAVGSDSGSTQWLIVADEVGFIRKQISGTPSWQNGTQTTEGHIFKWPVTTNIFLSDIVQWMPSTTNVFAFEGTSGNGLYRSTSAGAEGTWTQIWGKSSGGNVHRTNNLAIDPTSVGGPNGQIAYITTDDGVWRLTRIGTSTWTSTTGTTINASTGTGVATNIAANSTTWSSIVGSASNTCCAVAVDSKGGVYVAAGWVQQSAPSGLTAPRLMYCADPSIANPIWVDLSDNTYQKSNAAAFVHSVSVDDSATTPAVYIAGFTGCYVGIWQ